SKAGPNTNVVLRARDEQKLALAKRAVKDLLVRSQCFDPSVTTMSVSAGSCSLRSDRLSLLQLASLTTFAHSAAGSAASTGSTMLSPCWSRKNVCSPNKLVELCNHGVFVGNNARFELTQGLLDLCGVEFHCALLFQVCSKASPRDNRGLRASHLEVVKRYLRSLRIRPSDNDRTQRARCA